MQAAPLASNEEERLAALHRMAILDTAPEERFDVLTKEAIERLHLPIASISIIDADREWYKSCQGLSEAECKRELSFCGHALLAKNLFVVEDTLKDPRFLDHPMVVGAPNIRFYAGMALLDYATGEPVGVFCVKDTKSRHLTLEETTIFLDLAGRAEHELNEPA